MGLPEHFGQRLKELREQTGLTQQGLAEKAGLSQRAVSHWEQGLREPSWSMVLALCSALGVDCTTFTVVPAGKPGPRLRGRPPKGAPSVTPESGSASKTTKDMADKKKPTRGQGRNQNG